MVMFAQLDHTTTVNGNSTDDVSAIWRGREGAILVSAYRSISDHALGTSGGQSFNWLNDSTLSFIAAYLIAKLQKPVGQVQIREKNLRAIALLEEWFSEPDDLGPAFWENFDKDLEANRFTI
jgi:hypothetical protein